MHVGLIHETMNAVTALLRVWWWVCWALTAMRHVSSPSGFHTYAPCDHAKFHTWSDLVFIMGAHVKSQYIPEQLTIDSVQLGRHVHCISM